MNKDLLKEKRTHGDSMFPFRLYKVDFPSIGNRFDYHWHKEFEFLLVTEGKALFQIDTTDYEVKAGEAIFVNSGQLHAGFSTFHTFCSFYAMVFSPIYLYSHTYDLLQLQFIDPIVKYQYILPSLIKGIHPWEKDILTTINRLIQLDKERNYTYELLIKSYLYQLFSQMLSNRNMKLDSGGYNSNSYKTERIKEILQYIQNNYNKKLTIKELSQQHNMSEGHFCRFFKQMIRKTPIHYINHYRILKATQLLENTNNKISDIALEVGFDNFSYFISVFKQSIGVPPSQYRKQKENSIP